MDIMIMEKEGVFYAKKEKCLMDKEGVFVSLDQKIIMREDVDLLLTLGLLIIINRFKKPKIVIKIE